MLRYCVSASSTIWCVGNRAAVTLWSLCICDARVVDKSSAAFRYHLPTLSDMTELALCKHRELFSFRPGIHTQSGTCVSFSAYLKCSLRNVTAVSWRLQARYPVTVMTLVAPNTLRNCYHVWDQECQNSGTKIRKGTRTWRNIRNRKININVVRPCEKSLTKMPRSSLDDVLTRKNWSDATLKLIWTYTKLLFLKRRSTQLVSHVKAPTATKWHTWK
jgi:hypothetical protein